MAHLTSLREASYVVVVAAIEQSKIVTYSFDINPTILALKPYHIATRRDDNFIFYHLGDNYKIKRV